MLRFLSVVNKQNNAEVTKQFTTESDMDIPNVIKQVGPDQSERIRRKKEDLIRKYDQLMDKVMFLDLNNPQEQRRYKYSNETLMPYLFFFKYTAKKLLEDDNDEKYKTQRLKLWIPDTLVLNDRDLPPMWFYSSSDGYIYRSDHFTPRNVVVKFCENTTHSDELVCMIKKPHFKNLELVGNDVKPVTVKEMPSLCGNLIGPRGETTVLQRYIRSSGPKAYICRSVWKRNSNPLSWLITNKINLNDLNEPEQSRVIATATKRFSCTIIPCTSGRFITETLPYITTILDWMRHNYKVEFDEMACDFIRGKDNKWYFINMKGFTISKGISGLQTRHITHHGDEVIPFNNNDSSTNQKYQQVHTKTKQCRYCQIIYPAHKLTNKMTLKMILQTDHHLIYRGKKMPWILERIKLQHVDISMLFHEYLVCESCYTLYLTCENLMQIEFEFAKKLGIETSEDQRYNLVSLSHLDLSTKGKNVNLQRKANTIAGNGSNFIMPEDWELQLAPNSEVVPMSNQPHINFKLIKKMNQYRMMILIHQINDIPQINKNSGYSIQFDWLNQKVRYNLDTSQCLEKAQGFTLLLNRIKMFYLLSDGRAGISRLITQFPTLRFQLFEQKKKIGDLDCELSDFTSERVIKKDFFKHFGGKTISSSSQFLSWGLNLSIGIVDSGLVDIENIQLSEFNGIYLPEQSYYSCEPLPQEWMQTLTNLQSRLQPRSRNNMMQSSKFRYSSNTNERRLNASYAFSEVSKIFQSTSQKQHNTLLDQTATLDHDVTYDSVTQFNLLKKNLKNEINRYESETKDLDFLNITYS